MPTQVTQVTLVYKGDIVTIAPIVQDHQVKEVFYRWYKNIKPALKRGESVKIEIELVGT